MRVPNDLEFDTETYLLFSVYYEANGFLKGVDGSAASFMKHRAEEIQVTGQVLEWLGLATRDKESPLGWKPSHDLMSLIARPHKPSNSRKFGASVEDYELFDMILDAAVGELEEDSAIPGFVAPVLTGLGLMVRGCDGVDYIPTKRLRWLACKRRQEERHLREEERRVKSA
jgi:hypothetical protein